MNPIPKTIRRPFEIVIRSEPGAEPRHVETIEVDVIECNGEEFLTPESSALIEEIRARHMGLIQGAEIRSMRHRLGLSQKELTGLLQCGDKSLSRWENGHGYPTGIVNTLLRLLDEGFLAPESLRAVKGPRRRLPWTPPAKTTSQEREAPLRYRILRATTNLPADRPNPADSNTHALAA
jgi:DNA-binding transcriptional regulator YiaG